MAAKQPEGRPLPSTTHVYLDRLLASIAGIAVALALAATTACVAIGSRSGDIAAELERAEDMRLACEADADALALEVAAQVARLRQSIEFHMRPRKLQRMPK
mgnify:CR=1 FL=1